MMARCQILRRFIIVLAALVVSGGGGLVGFLSQANAAPVKLETGLAFHAVSGETTSATSDDDFLSDDDDAVEGIAPVKKIDTFALRFPEVEFYLYPPLENHLTQAHVVAPRPVRQVLAAFPSCGPPRGV
jgi:hypothetical protein